MSTLFLLNTNDFKISENKLTFTKSKNLTFVLFYSTKCKFCGPAREVFNFVASQYSQRNVKFGIINITKNPSIPELSKNTNTAIKFVPFLIAFFEGVPISVFTNQYTPENFSDFVQKCHLSVADSFGSSSKKEEVPEVPGYSIGVPFCEEGVCYLGFDDAYIKK